MLQTNTVYELLSKKEKSSLKFTSKKNGERSEPFGEFVIDYLNRGIKDYLIKNQLKIKFLSSTDLKNEKLKKAYEEAGCFSYVNFSKFLICIVRPETNSKVENCKQIIHNLLHEIGHLVLHRLVADLDLIAGLKELLLNFARASDEEKGVSEYAEKYMKDEYGKRTNKRLISRDLYNYDLKYHENFCETFRIYFEYALDSIYNSGLVDPFIKHPKTLETFKQIINLF